MADVKTTLRVQIVADLADIKQGLGLLRGELARVKKEAAGAGGGSSLLASASSELKSLLPSLGIAALATGFAAAGHRAEEAADAIGKMAQKTGASVQLLSTLRVAVHGNAEEMALLEKSLLALAKRQDDAASGNKDALNSFQRLGVSIADVKSKNPGELFTLLIDKFGGMKAGAEKAALAQDIFSKSGAQLIPILNELAHGGLSEAEDRARRLGLYLSDDMVAAAAAGKDAMADLGLVAEGVASSFESKVAPVVTGAMQDMFGAVTGSGTSMAEILGQAVSGVLTTIMALFNTSKTIISGTITSALYAASAVADIARLLAERNLSGAKDRFVQALAQQKSLVLGYAKDIGAGFSKAFDAFGGTLQGPKGRPSGGGTGTGGSSPSGDPKQIVHGIVDDAELAADAIKRELSALDAMLADGLISLADYYSKKRALQEASIDAQIRQAEAEAKTATTSEQQSKALTKIVELQRDRAAVGPDLAREQAKAEEELRKQLEGVKAELADLDGFDDQAVRARLEQQYAALMQKLKAESDTAGLAMVQSLINRKAAQAQLQGLEQDITTSLSRLQTGETAISSQVDAGLLAQSLGEQQLHDLREKTIAQLEEMRAKLLAYLAAHTGPEHEAALEALQRLDGELAQVQASQATLFGLNRGEVIDQAENALSGFLTDIATRAKTAKEALLDLVRNFIQGIARMAAEALAKRAILSIFGMFGGGAAAGATNFGIPLLGSGPFSGLGGGAGLAAAGIHHTGGIAGSGGLTRAMAWDPAGVLRYHGGGFAGLGANEVRAVLERGEEILTTKDPRHRFNGGAAGPAGRVTTPIVAIGDDAIADALASHAGEQVVLTHVRNNWDGLMGGNHG